MGPVREGRPETMGSSVCVAEVAEGGVVLAVPLGSNVINALRSICKTNVPPLWNVPGDPTRSD